MSTTFSPVAKLMEHSLLAADAARAESWRSPLAEQVRVKFTYEHYLALQAIDAVDFSKVKLKVAQDEGLTDERYLDGGIAYLKRYYAIHILDPLNPPAMSKPIDPFWHAHVLYSQDYMNFCDRVFGQYIHHIPLLYSDIPAVKFVSDMYVRTRRRHHDIFGDVDESYFPSDPKQGLCCSPAAATRLANFCNIALFPEEKMLHILARKGE